MDLFDKFEPLLKRAADLKAHGAYYYMRRLESASDSTVTVKGRKMINFASNNYLGLANHPKVKEAAIRALEKYGLGTGGSRILSGTLELHESLEEKLSRFKGMEDAVVFSTGYMANVGVVSSTVGSGEVIVIDEKCHASIIDGCLFSRARFFSYAHNDIKSLEERLSSIEKQKNILIITDSVFSMDGDIANLPEIIKLARKYNAKVMIDEAHATGVIGKKGRGITEYFNMQERADIEVGTLSKALGGLGGYVAGSTKLVSYLKHGARSFLFTTSLPAAVLAGVSKALDIICEEPELIEQLWDNINQLKKGLSDIGFNTGKSNSAIIPVLIGEEELANKIARFLEEKNIFVNPVAFPAVEKGKAIIRMSVMATHKKEEIARTLDTFSSIKRKFAIN